MEPTGLGLRRLLSDSTYNLIRQGWAILIGIGVSALLARGLGSTDRGVFTIALFLPETLHILLNLGIGQATVYYVSRRDWTPDRVLGGNLNIGIWIGLVGVSIGCVIILMASDWLFPSTPKPLLLIGLVILPVKLLTSYLNSIFHGLQDFRMFNLIGMVSQLLLLILVILFVWIFSAGVFGAMLAYLGSNLGGLIFLLFILGRKIQTPIGLRWKPDITHLKTAMHYGLKVSLANWITYLNYRFDNLLINTMSNVTQVGLYSVAVGLGERLWIPSTAISTVILPRIASQHHDEAGRRTITPLSARYVTWMSLAMAIVLLPLAERLIVLIYSEEFRGAAQAFRYILPGIIMLNTARILANDIAGRGKPELNLVISTIALLVNILANFVLIPKLASRGAALASSISYSILAILTFITYVRLTHVPWYTILLPTPSDGIYLKRARELARMWLRSRMTKP